MDTPSVVAGLLHDVIEDTAYTYDDIAKNFGKEIANLTEGVTKLGKIPFSSREEQQAENLRKMLMAMSEDIRVIIIKFADRMHNLSTLEYVSPQKQRDKALECLEVYAPIAHRLGMRTVKEYMEDVSLKYLDPVAYHEIEENLEARSTRRKQFVESTKELIRSRVEPLIPGVYIEGRVKSINGIYARCSSRARASTRSTTCSRCASSSTRSSTATTCSASCTTCSRRCRTASRTIFDAEAEHVPVAAHDRHQQGGIPFECRSAPGRCTTPPNTASRRTGNTSSA